MQLRQIEVFHAVMITGSTTGAAARLNVTQPAISTTLARMQDELGLTLFGKVSGRLVPTAEADLLFRQVCALKEDVDQLRRTAQRLAAGHIGHIRLGVVPALGEGISARAIANLRQTSPDVTISLDVLNTHDLLHRLRTGRIDVAAIFGGPADLPVQVIHQQACDLFAIVPQGWHPEKRSLKAQDLKSTALALMRPTDPIGGVVSEWLGPVPSTIEVRTSRAAIAMARSGVAVGFADSVTLREIDVSPASTVPLALDPKVEMTVVRDNGRSASRAEAEFVEALIAQIK